MDNVDFFAQRSEPDEIARGGPSVAREKVGVVIEVWAYGDDETGQQWGYVMTPWQKDSGGIPYATPEEGIEVVKGELQRAYRESAAKRKRRDEGNNSPASAVPA